ncbi:hypothetical protein HanPSC8_Chr01g0026601 [Helianthus annuus]|nr:hypothetical protein HanPSC8_Chr01g0026601 [Helianthus annuus]
MDSQSSLDFQPAVENLYTKNFFKTGVINVYTQKFYTKTMYSPLTSEKLGVGRPPPPSRRHKATPMVI